MGFTVGFMMIYGDHWDDLQHSPTLGQEGRFQTQFRRELNMLEIWWKYGGNSGDE